MVDAAVGGPAVVGGGVPVGSGAHGDAAAGAGDPGVEVVDVAALDGDYALGEATTDPRAIAAAMASGATTGPDERSAAPAAGAGDGQPDGSGAQGASGATNLESVDDDEGWVRDGRAKIVTTSVAWLTRGETGRRASVAFSAARDDGNPFDPDEWSIIRNGADGGYALLWVHGVDSFVLSFLLPRGLSERVRGGDYAMRPIGFEQSTRGVAMLVEAVPRASAGRGPFSGLAEARPVRMAKNDAEPLQGWTWSPSGLAMHNGKRPNGLIGYLEFEDDGTPCMDDDAARRAIGDAARFRCQGDMVAFDHPLPGTLTGLENKRYRVGPQYGRMGAGKTPANEVYEVIRKVGDERMLVKGDALERIMVRDEGREVNGIGDEATDFYRDTGVGHKNNAKERMQAETTQWPSTRGYVMLDHPERDASYRYETNGFKVLERVGYCIVSPVIDKIDGGPGEGMPEGAFMEPVYRVWDRLGDRIIYSMRGSIAALDAGTSRTLRGIAMDASRMYAGTAAANAQLSAATRRTTIYPTARIDKVCGIVIGGWKVIAWVGEISYETQHNRVNAYLIERQEDGEVRIATNHVLLRASRTDSLRRASTPGFTDYLLNVDVPTLNTEPAGDGRGRSHKQLAERILTNLGTLTAATTTPLRRNDGEGTMTGHLTGDDAGRTSKPTRRRDR